MISPKKTSADAGPSAQMIFLQTSHRSDDGAAGELSDRSAHARPFNQHSAALASSRKGLFGASGPAQIKYFRAGGAPSTEYREDILVIERQFFCVLKPRGEKQDFRNGRNRMGSDRPQRFRSIPSAAGQVTRLAAARLHDEGKDVAAILLKAGLTQGEVSDPTARLEVPAQIKFLELAAEALEDDLLGFHLARNFELREVGLLYYVGASSENLAEAFLNGARFSRINNEGVRLQVAIGQTMTVALEYVNVDRLTDKHQAEFWLVALIRICRQLTDMRLAPLRLKVQHFRDETPAELRTFLACDVEFSADADEVVFPNQFATLPVVTHDRFLNNLLLQYAEEALARRSPERENFRLDIERVLTQLLPNGRLGASEVARKLGMSPRTLSRKLSVQGTTYARILDGFRAALARRYLTERELPVSEVAWLLGYNELSSFTHAFKRWTGLTPRQFRTSNAA